MYSSSSIETVSPKRKYVQRARRRHKQYYNKFICVGECTSSI